MGVANEFAVSTTGKSNEKRNKYACGCAIIASIISILMGYGKLAYQNPKYHNKFSYLFY
jgi:hypothetical protein